MTHQEMVEFIMCIKRAVVEDEQQMRAVISDIKESSIADLNTRDQRDARLQHYMYAHNVAIDKHINSYQRDVENLNSLYRETFGCPRTYTKEREIVERQVARTTFAQRLNDTETP